MLLRRDWEHRNASTRAANAESTHAGSGHCAGSVVQNDTMTSSFFVHVQVDVKTVLHCPICDPAGPSCVAESGRAVRVVAIRVDDGAGSNVCYQ